MLHINSLVYTCNITKLLAFLYVWIVSIHQISCFSLAYSRFRASSLENFIISGDAIIHQDALQLIPNTQNHSAINKSSRIVYKHRLRLWNKKTVASFTSLIVLKITSVYENGGEGLAFILAKDFQSPPNSHGQWLGIVNATTNGSHISNIVAVEFDTKKSFEEDIDNNHVGFNINSVYSNKSASLNETRITLTSGGLIYVAVYYDGNAKVITATVNQRLGPNLSLSMPLDLSQYLPSEVYVGFSASTGSGAETHMITTWYLIIDDLDHDMVSWVPIAIPIMVAGILTCVACYFYQRRKSNTRQKHHELPSIQHIEAGLGLKKMKLKDLKVATRDFNPSNELGRGGFGIVYKGNWEDREVAVKRIINTPLGKQNLIAEITTIGSLRHKNLVELIGWCYESSELLLVYEHMPNGSLDKLIRCNNGTEKGKIMCWKVRYNIICGVAQALDYLHNECPQQVLHRDIKPSNILLDSEFNPRLGDFGLARMFKLSERSHHSTIAGTPGYMAPEILLTGRTTTKSDIYAFGVVILAVICGKTPGVQDDEGTYSNSIVNWTWQLYESKRIGDAIDPKLKGDIDKEKAECLLVLGLACCHPNPHVRPSIRNVIQVLIGESPPPYVPFEKPAFVWPATATAPEGFLSGGVLTSCSVLNPR